MILTGMILALFEWQSKSDLVHKMWQQIIELKFVMSLMLTPAIYPVTSMFAQD